LNVDGVDLKTRIAQILNLKESAFFVLVLSAQIISLQTDEFVLQHRVLSGLPKRQGLHPL
jgi:hypothetical protein